MAVKKTLETLTQRFVRVPACTHLKVNAFQTHNNSSSLNKRSHDRDGFKLNDLN